MKNNLDFSTLFDLASEVRANAYAPHSNFKVGVAVKTDQGNFYAGCNVENAAYPSSICAEVNAITTMVAKGEQKISEILIVGGTESEVCTPCGNCRQVINEFATKDTVVHLCHPKGHHRSLPFSDLLPFAFRL